MTKNNKNKNKNKNKNTFTYREKRCYRCGCKVIEKEIIYENTKWGGGAKFPEKVKANVCERCGELTFSSEEAKRLQELSREYE